MSAAARLLVRARSLGVVLTARAGCVAYDAPAGALTSDLLAEMRRHKGDLLDLLAQDGPASAPETPGVVDDRTAMSRFRRVPLQSRSGSRGSNVEVPHGWIEGVERLAHMNCPSQYPPAAWEQAILDAERFMDCWAGQAATLGWPDWEVWGVHRRAPWHRLDGHGLVLALGGDKVGALTETEAVLVKPSGARLTFRRRARDPLPPSERALMWELE